MTRRSARLAVALCCAVAGLSGCSGPRALSPSSRPLAVTAMTSLPPPTGADLVAATAPYHIGPYDKLDIAVFGATDLSGELQTDAGGRLSMPLVGVLDAAGKTPSELAAMIAGRLRGVYVRDPQVTVNLKETTSNVFTIDGQVTQPGSYPVVGSMTLMRAVAVAKGAGDYARLDDVVVFRTVNGKPLAALYNLQSIRQGLYADPQIFPNDMVVVGNSQARRQFQQFLQIAPLLSTPVILALEKR